MLLYSWNKPLHHLANELPNLKEVSQAILSSALENEKISDKLQKFIERQFRQVSILQRAFLLCSWIKEVTSVMHKEFWNISFYKKKIHVFYMLDWYYIRRSLVIHRDRVYCKGIRFHCNFWYVQPSLYCTQFLQKLASSWVVDILSRFRELEYRICNLSIFLKVSQDICFEIHLSSFSVLLKLKDESGKEEKRKLKLILNYVSTFKIPNSFLIGWLQNPNLECFILVCVPQILIW